MRFLAAFLLVLAASCKDVFSSDPLGFVGTYALVKVDGLSLPARISTGFTVRGTAELKANGHYALSQSDSATNGAVTATSSTGTWNVENNAVVLRDDAGPLLLGLIASDTLSIQMVGHQNVYVQK